MSVASHALWTDRPTRNWVRCRTALLRHVIWLTIYNLIKLPQCHYGHALCPVTDISIGDGGTDRREILHDGFFFIILCVLSAFIWRDKDIYYISVPDRSPLLRPLQEWRHFDENTGTPGDPQIRNFGSKFLPRDSEYLENVK